MITVRHQKIKTCISILLALIFATVLTQLYYANALTQTFEGNHIRTLTLAEMTANSSKPAIKRQRFNSENEGKQFGKLDQFGIKIDLTEIKKHPEYDRYVQANAINHIQVGSVYDYANISNTVDFKKLSDELFNTLAYELIEFPLSSEPQKNGSQLLTLNSQHLPVQNSTPLGYLKEKLSFTNQIQLQLAKNLYLEPKNAQYQEIEYNYYNLKYGIGEISSQLPICIYASGYKLAQKNQYKYFFQSLQHQNYTNFHIVYIDDHSPEPQFTQILSYLESQPFLLKPRLKFIRTLQNIKATANMYFWINRLCGQGDIVVHVDADDGLVGRQALKVLNAVYQNPNYWFVYSRYVWRTSPTGMPDIQILINGQSKELETPVDKYRNTVMAWDVSHLRTFRKKLFEKIPMQMMMEYQIDQQNGLAFPHFGDAAADTYEIFSLLEMCGQERYRYITDYLYIYLGTTSQVQDSKRDCFAYHEKMDDFKSRMKTPLQKLNSLDQPAIQIPDFQGRRQIFNTMSYHRFMWKDCLGKP